ncbi:MAG: MBL fold metallo-hydrolase [Chloroflexota bacterium]
MTTQFIDEDFVAVWREQDRQKRLATLAFGDEVEILQQLPGWTEVRVVNYFDGTATGFIEGTPDLRDDGIVRFSMVDVQQGDGLILETPSGKIISIDGGDNKLFARHAAARFRYRQSSKTSPLEVDAIIVTHGDGDHYSGLNDVKRSESLPRTKAHKRLFIKPKRVFSNGIVKAPGSVDDDERLGSTVARNGTRYLVDLFDDPRTAPPGALNADFKEWNKTLDHWEKRGAIEFTRVYHGMAGRPFKFLEDEGIKVEI